jgi:3-deoxy-7-phosphoheptulonate synthase
VHAGGLHLETTGAPVTECIGGRSGLSAVDLPRRYESLCDPRLNADQSMEIAALAASLAGGVVRRDRAA